jgi:hypothetical protein
VEGFIAPADRTILARHGLASFDALWAAQLDRVDVPNLGRGGWSTVCRLDLDGRGYYLKRQCNHRTRSLTAPFGEPTFAREFRNIRRFESLAIPALTAAFFARRRLERMGDCAILLTHALDGWQPLAHWLPDWPAHPEPVRARLLAACGKLAGRLHAAGMLHGCFYPKHVFLRDGGDTFEACLIDLEKVRPLLLGRYDRCRDLDQFFRRAHGLGEDDAGIMLAAYLDCAPESAEVADWRRHLARRGRHKNAT